MFKILSNGLMTKKIKISIPLKKKVENLVFEYQSICLKFGQITNFFFKISKEFSV